MNKILIALALLFLAQTIVAAQEFVFPTATDYPQIKTSGDKIEEFVPRGWTVVSRVSGDLNADKQPDCVLIVKAGDNRFLNKNDGLGAQVFDTNPRVLLILFKAQNGYRLAQQSNGFIKIPDAPTMEEPFQEATIKNGVLELIFQIFYSAGSWGMSNYTYKFRYQNAEFALIGADKSENMRNTGEYEDRSYNFLTRKVRIEIGNNSEDRPQKVRLRAFKFKELKTLNTLKEPFAWEIEPNSFI